MSVFSKIIVLSKQIASAILKGKSPTGLENSEIFNENDKEYILKNITDGSLIRERQNLTNQINNKTDLEKVKSKITIPVRKMYYKQMAAAMVIGILATGYFFKDDLFSISNNTSNIVVKSKIEIGTDKAILTLDDGSSIVLEKGKTIKTNHITSNGTELVYTPSKQSKTEVKYNYLTIPRGGQFYLKLPDGTRVWLNSESQLKFPIAFTEGKTREVNLVYGEAYFDVSPSTNHKGAKFRVINKNQEIEVLGTEFNIKAYRDDFNTYTTLVEGKVVVNFEGKRQNLKPSQQSILNHENNNLTVSTVDIYNATSWKYGVFSFENKPLKDIMKVLSRWYDIEVVFEDKTFENEEFNGVLNKNQNIEDILNIIKNFKTFNSYEINNKRVILK